MMARKHLARPLVALLIVGLLAGCSGSTAQAPTPAPGGGNNASAKQLNVVLPAGRPETDFVKQNAADFEKATGVKVNIQEIPYENLHTKLVTELKAGSSTADIVGMPYEWTASFQPWLGPIDKYLTDADRKDLLKAALDGTQISGQTYGIMYTITSQILFYRKDLLDAKKIAVPQTWSEYVSAAKALTTPDVWGAMVTAKNTQEPVGMFLNYLYEAGGDIADAQGNVTVNGQAGVKALTFMSDLVNKEKVAPPGATNYMTIDTTNMFKEGKLAMAPNWTYMWAMVNADDSKVKGKVGMAVLPKDQKYGVSIGGWTLAMFKRTADPETAYKFIQFMTDTDRQKVMALKFGNTPVRHSAAEDAQVAAIPFVPVMVKALDDGVPRLKTAAWPEVENALAAALSAAVSQQMTPQQALDQAAQTIKQAMQQAKS